MAQSIVGAFQDNVRAKGNARALRFRGDTGNWEEFSWHGLDEARERTAAGLLQLGVEEDDRVGILANTCMRWILGDLAIQSVGAISVPIYQSSIAKEVAYIINDAGISVLMVEDETQLHKVLAVREELPALEKVILMSGAPEDSGWSMSWAELDRLGRAEEGEGVAPKLLEAVRARVAALTPARTLTIVYTSGTTGTPKGAVIPHSAMLYMGSEFVATNFLKSDSAQFLFLPLAHIFARVLEVAFFMTAMELAVDSEIPRIVDNLAELRPTMMASVPRIFEKVYARIVDSGLAAPGAKGKLFAWALSINDAHAAAVTAQQPLSFALKGKLALAKKLVFSKVNARLSELFGGRLEFFISGGAPLPKKVACFFDNAGVVILEGWGLTETSAATCVNRPDNHKLGTVGIPFNGTELSIAPDGEILVRGPLLMTGYYKRPEATAEAIDPEGWFHTGDIGTLDSDGHLRITDRKKDIIVTAGGKNIAPQAIENRLKTSDALISQVLLYGDKRKYLTALITIDADALAGLAEEKSLTGSYAAQCSSEPVRQRVEEAVEAVNADLPRYSTIKRFVVLDHDFEIGDQLTPTLKVKRRFCNEKYQTILSGMYEENLE